MTLKQTPAEITEDLVEKVTDYGYNDEYGYYNDWADGVRPIIQSHLLSRDRALINVILEMIEKMKQVPDCSENEDNSCTPTCGYNQALSHLSDELKKLL